MPKKVRKKSIVIFEDREAVVKKMKTYFKGEFRGTGIPIKFFKATVIPDF